MKNINPLSMEKFHTALLQLEAIGIDVKKVIHDFNTMPEIKDKQLKNLMNYLKDKFRDCPLAYTILKRTGR